MGQIAVYGRQKRFDYEVGAAWLIGAALILAPIGGLVAQTAGRTSAGENVEETVVIARRSGISVWRVEGPRAAVVLVGSIGSVAPGTHWDPSALEAALAQADRVMFPEAMRVNFGLFSAIGLISKWRSQASLPKGTTLQALTAPEQ